MPKTKRESVDFLMMPVEAPRSLGGSNLTPHELKEMREIVGFILEKNGGYSRNFVNHLIDILGLLPLDEDSAIPPDFGFFEDKVMLSRDFIATIDNYAGELENASERE